MCGIIAMISIELNIIEYLLKGLYQLKNRGYDSAGFSIIENNKFIINKYASSEECSIKRLDNINLKNNYKSTNGIAHTRWATHGIKSDINSHPHVDNNGLFSIVHNGIIENYSELKEFLLEKGYKFYSQTDTEVIVNLISYYYKEIKDVEKTLSKVINILEGTWGIALLCLHEPDKLYITRHGSPILISIQEKFAIISSEQSGFDNLVQNYIVLNDYDICVLEKKDSNIIYRTQSNYKQINAIRTDINKLNNYKHWTIKEIEEQYDASLRAINIGGRLLNNNSVKLGGINEYKYSLKEMDNIIILGCGTSYHAGMVGLEYFKEICNFNTVQIFDGAEFEIKDIPRDGKTVIILCSQSGETKDLHRCLLLIKNLDIVTIGVINVVNSMIAREVDCGCHLNAGKEVGVASTKSFTSQVIILTMIAIWFSQLQNINEKKRKQIIVDLRKINSDIKNIIENCKEKCMEISDSLKKSKSMFILGKGKSHAIAKEGSLKIKEITYIHAEGYSGSSLKHGPFGLLEKDFPVILISPQDEHDIKMQNVYNEIITRDAKVYTITDNITLKRDNLITIPYNKTFGYLLSVIPLQYISYYISVKKGIDPDYPRNLAMVVTVE